jgi:hypothetical protein
MSRRMDLNQFSKAGVRFVATCGQSKFDLLITGLAEILWERASFFAGLHVRLWR